MSAEGIPQLAAVMGSCTAGGAYVPAMSDETVIVGHRHDLPRRPAAREGRDRRGGDAPRSSAAPTSTRASAASPTTTRCPTSTRWRWPRESSRTLERRPLPRLGAARRRGAGATIRRSCTASSRPTRARPYDVREVIARIVDGSRLDEFKPLYGETLVVRLRAHLRATRSASWPTTASCSRSPRSRARTSSSCACQREIPLALPAEHHRLHGRPRVRARRHRQGRRQAGHGRRLRPGAEADGDRRRLVRRRQLRHVRAGVRAAPAVDVAERAHLGDGRASRPRETLLDGRLDALRARGEDLRRGRTQAFMQPILDKYESEGSAYYSTARLWDDGILDPLDTRRVLALGLAAARTRAGRPSRASACFACERRRRSSADGARRGVVARPARASTTRSTPR